MNVRFGTSFLFLAALFLGGCNLSGITIKSQPSAVTIIKGEDVSFSVEVVSTTELKYQWNLNGNEIAGETGNSLSISKALPSQAGEYTVLVSGQTGSVLSDPAELVVNVPPSISTQPQARNIIQGSSVSFSVVASGTGPMSFQWKKNEEKVAGATSSTLELANVQANQAGIYSVTVTNVAGEITSSGVALVVNVPATIATQPAALTTLNPGQATTLSVVAAGTAPLNYQWRKDGVNISGATMSSLALSNIQAAQAGVYSVVVTNLVGSVTSANASVNINVPPSITTQPIAVTAMVGQSATFSVSASGTAPLSYRWRKDTVNISGATSSSLTLNNLLSSQAGTYSVSVSNPAGSVISNNAALVVNSAPVITMQPAPVTVNSGQVATFNVTATGTAPMSYQWRKDGVNIPGTTSSSIVLGNASPVMDGVYSVVVSNPAGSVTSSNAALSVNVAPSIVAQPVSATTITGSSAGSPGGVVFSVTATGTAPISYQWKKDGVNISGATSASLPFVNVQENQSGSYTVVVSNVVSSVTSNAANLVVNTPVSIVTQPAAQTINAGQSATFTVAASGTAPLSYQWRRDGANVSGATSSSLVISNAQLLQSGSYTVVVTNVVGSVTSAGAALNLILPPVISQQPLSQTVGVGDGARLYATVTSATNVSLQWKKDGANLVGETNTYLELRNVQANQAGVYALVATNSAGSVTSDNATLIVNSSPSIATQPSSLTLTVGQNASFSVVASGSGTLSYQWRKDGVNISGANSASLSFVNVQENQSGAYTVVISNVVSSVTSNAANLVVNTPVSIVTQPVPQTINAGQSTTFSVAATGTAPLSYQWKKDGINISGATSSSLLINNAQILQSGSYTVVVTNVVGSVASAGAALNLILPPVISQQPLSQTAPVGDSPRLLAVVTSSTNVSLQWKKDGANLVGETNTYLELRNVQANQAGVYALVATNSAGSVTSDNATLIVNASPSIATQPSSLTLTVGQNATFSVVASGSGTLSYQWRKDGANVSGATSSSLNLTNVQVTQATVYSVIVSNAGGSVTSANATLTVNAAAAPPVINPTVTVNSPVEGQLIGRYLISSYTVSDRSKMSSLQVYVDGLPHRAEQIAEPFSAVIYTQLMTEGPHMFSFKLKFNDGYEVTTPSVNFVVDKTPPVINWLTPLSGATILGDQVLQIEITGETVVPILTVSTEFGEILSSDDVVVQNPMRITLPASSIPLGPMYLVISATDRAGNYSSPLSRSFTNIGTGSAIRLDTTSYVNPIEAGTRGAFPFIRSGDLSKAQQIAYSITGGTARSGVDFVAPSGIIDFAVGQTTSIINIDAIDDSFLEGTESFVFTLQPQANVSFLGSSAITVYLGDNDDSTLNRSVRLGVSWNATGAPTLSWSHAQVEAGDSYVRVFRRRSDENSWGTSIFDGPSITTSFVDSVLSTSVTYEYKAEVYIRSTSWVLATGYITTGRDSIVPLSQGSVLLLVEANLRNAIETNLQIFMNDLRSDGWAPRVTNISAALTPVQTKEYIKNFYNENSTQNRTVILIGHISVPYSGVSPADGHVAGVGDHQGAWTADTFYADIDGVWTDNATMLNGWDRLNNVPGDGKYDQNTTPTDLEMAIGRIDLSNMPAFAPLSEADLTNRYFVKNHRFRFAQNVPDRKLIMNDYLGLYAPNASSGYRFGSSLVGLSNVVTGQSWLKTPNSYLLGTSYSFSGYNYSENIAFTAPTTTHANVGDYVNDKPKVVFNFMFGSFFADWDVGDSLLRAPLASEAWGLTNAWAGRGDRYYHYMGVGWPIGKSMLQSLNGGLYADGWRAAHSDLMGDPTLRLHSVAPVSNLSCAYSTGMLQMTWTKSPDPAADSVYLMRSNSPDGPWTYMQRIQNNPSTASGATPIEAVAVLATTPAYYMIRALKYERTPAGGYYNMSPGQKCTFSVP